MQTVFIFSKKSGFDKQYHDYIDKLAQLYIGCLHMCYSLLLQVVADLAINLCTTLWVNSADIKLIFFQKMEFDIPCELSPFFPENRIWHFIQTVSIGLGMTYHILFYGKHFSQEQDLTFHANCLQWRQFWTTYQILFYGKIRKLFQYVVCWKFYIVSINELSKGHFVNYFSRFNIQYSDIFCWKNVSSFCNAKATHSDCFSKKFQHIWLYQLNVNFNESLTNDVVSFEQLQEPRIELYSILFYVRTYYIVL